MILPHIEVLTKLLKIENWDSQDESIVISRSGLIDFLRHLANESNFDEYFYLETYPDVREAVNSGKFVSGLDHYQSFGFLEGRIPSMVSFNHKEYLRIYEDVAEYASNTRNKKKAAVEHFVKFGFAEGRGVLPGASH